MGDPLMTIGQMAKASRLGVKALRHHEGLAILKPEAKRPGSRYRLYGPRQLVVARRIAWYRKLGLPLRQIVRLLKSHDPEVERQILATVRGRTEARIWGGQIALHRLDRALTETRRVRWRRKQRSSSTAKRNGASRRSSSIKRGGCSKRNPGHRSEMTR
jgi:DNA-binding transcriptional MerR regulator